MQRRTAIATAAAITMSLTSGVVAIGANTGLFNFTANAASRPAPVTVVQGGAGNPAAVPAVQAKVHVERGESHENGAQQKDHQDD